LPRLEQQDAPLGHARLLPQLAQPHGPRLLCVGVAGSDRRARLERLDLARAALDDRARLRRSPPQRGLLLRAERRAKERLQLLRHRREELADDAGARARHAVVCGGGHTHRAACTA